MLTVLVLIMPGIGGTALVIYGTRGGLGISADSVHYISAARELAVGHGLVVPWGHAKPYAMTHWPPLYPAILAGMNKMGLPAIVGGRWLNAMSFGAMLVLFTLIVYQATGSLWLAGVGGMLLCTSRDLLAIYSMAWSEPAFLMFTLAGIVLLAKANAAESIPRPQMGRGTPLPRGHRVFPAPLSPTAALLLACLTMTLALLTRYAGGALVLAAVASLWWQAGPRRRRLKRCAMVLLIVGLPMALWMARNVADGEPVTSRHFAWQLCSATTLLNGCRVISAWVYPWILSSTPLGNTGSIVLTLLMALILCGMTVCARCSPAFKRPGQPGRLQVHLCWVSGLYLGAYLIFLFIAKLFFDHAIPFRGHRIMQIMIIPSLLLGLLGGYMGWVHTGRSKAIAGFAVVACLCIMMIRVPRIVIRSAELPHVSGFGAEGFHDAKWRASPTMAAVKKLAASRPVYSNAADAIYILAGRNSLWLPRRLHEKSSGKVGVTAEMQTLKESLSHGGFIVYFNRLAWRKKAPPPRLLRKDIPRLHPIVQTADGAIYALADGTD